jgi:hypothetical protein
MPNVAEALANRLITKALHRALDCALAPSVAPVRS